MFAAAIALSLVATYAAAAALHLVGVFPADQPALALTVLIDAVVALGLVRLLVAGPGALSWSAMGVRLPGPGEGTVGQDVAWGIAMAVPAYIAAIILAAALTLALGVVPEPTVPLTRDPLGLIVDLLAAAVIAPIWEEAFFRGYATAAWARALGERAAIVRGGLFFAAVHLLDVVGADFSTGARLALVVFVARLPVSMLLGWVFLRRRTLIAPIALHATYNAVPILLFAALGAGVTG